MAIMYAPYIESVIPAFGYDVDDDGSSNPIILKIPYQHNPGVSKNEFDAFMVKISDLNDKDLGSWHTTVFTDTEATFQGWFKVSGQPVLSRGNYYKIQLGYYKIEKKDPVTYSTVGIAKYIGQVPTVSLHKNSSNQYKKFFQYFPNNSGETPYSCLLTASNGKQKEIFFSNKNSQDSKLIVVVNFLEQDQEKKFDTVLITTNNGYQCSCDSKDATAPAGNNQIFFNISNKQNKITFEKDLQGKQESYLVLKSTDEKNWYPISVAKDTFGDLGSDQILETGNLYCYRLIDYDCKSNMGKIIQYSGTIDYEHIYLSDSDKTLCIKFNPKISSFKSTIQESKQDTIGGKYPIFYRNGNLGYKEFSINGLISYHMDENEEFIKQEKLGFSADEDKIPTHNLIGYNIAAERKFRNAVLDWLNNGEVKLFKSPTEGVFLVRLMNISLSPEEKLGRMLYSFSATAYEADEINYENLVKYGFIPQIEGVDYVVG